MAGLPLVVLNHGSGARVSVRSTRYSNGDPLNLCGRLDCRHYSEQQRLSFVNAERDGFCRLAHSAVAYTCVALDLDEAERHDAAYRAACSIEKAAALEVERIERSRE